MMADVYNYPEPLLQVNLDQTHRVLIYDDEDPAIGHLCTEWIDDTEPDGYLRTWEAIDLGGFVLEGDMETVTIRPTITHERCGMIAWVTEGVWQDSTDYPAPDDA